MVTRRISADINIEDHKSLKMCCTRLNISIKDFLLTCVMEKIDHMESEWQKNSRKKR